MYTCMYTCVHVPIQYLSLLSHPPSLLSLSLSPILSDWAGVRGNCVELDGDGVRKGGGGEGPSRQLQQPRPSSGVPHHGQSTSVRTRVHVYLTTVSVCTVAVNKNFTFRLRSTIVVWCECLRCCKTVSERNVEWCHEMVRNIVRTVFARG